MQNYTYRDCRMHTGILVCIQAGITKIFACRDPHWHNKIVRILGATYMLLPICAQFCYANGDSPYAKFPAFLPVRVQGVPVCVWGSVCNVLAIFPPVAHWSRIVCMHACTQTSKIIAVLHYFNSIMLPVCIRGYLTVTLLLWYRLRPILLFCAVEYGISSACPARVGRCASSTAIPPGSSQRASHQTGRCCVGYLDNWGHWQFGWCRHSPQECLLRASEGMVSGEGFYLHSPHKTEVWRDPQVLPWSDQQCWLSLSLYCWEQAGIQVGGKVRCNCCRERECSACSAPN